MLPGQCALRHMLAIHNKSACSHVRMYVGLYSAYQSTHANMESIHTESNSYAMRPTNIPCQSQCVVTRYSSNTILPNKAPKIIL